MPDHLYLPRLVALVIGRGDDAQLLVYHSDIVADQRRCQTYQLSDVRVGIHHLAQNPYEDVAPIVLFLASDESHWMSGQNLFADGGARMTA